MSHLVSDYFYELPQELIASRPTPDRESARLLVIERASGKISHRIFREFPEFLREGDQVVLNDTRVLKARLLTPDRRMEIFLLEAVGERRWKCLVRPGRKLKRGIAVDIADTTAKVLEVLPGGERIMEFRASPDLDKHGHMPIPPYFQREADLGDEERYQTVFAGQPGSVAAPTAGLHFTPRLLANVPHCFLTLHVGAGTFLPVKAEKIEDHIMHEESYEIPAATAETLNKAERIVAVGTTVARVLESQKPGPLQARSGRTAIFIHPPRRLKRVGALLTNFHLPCSTLLMLVCAFAGTELIRKAYAEAIRERYRFFSYGDCMLIL